MKDNLLRDCINTGDHITVMMFSIDGLDQILASQSGTVLVTEEHKRTTLFVGDFIISAEIPIVDDHVYWKCTRNGIDIYERLLICKVGSTTLTIRMEANDART